MGFHHPRDLWTRRVKEEGGSGEGENESKAEVKVECSTIVGPKGEVLGRFFLKYFNAFIVSKPLLPLALLNV